MQLPYKPQRFRARVRSKKKISSKVYELVFEPQEPSELRFIAGQTLMLHVSPGVNRSMSIASPPSKPLEIMIAHDVSPMGPGSRWTVALDVGDEVSFIAPLGAFVLEKESTRKKMLIATGTGVAPFRSMVYDYLMDGQQKTAHLVLYWGLRYEEDIFWKDELEKLANAHDLFQFHLTLSQPTASWAGKKGRVTNHIFENESVLSENEFYLCGSKEMVKEMEGLLLGKSVPKEQIKRELFY